MKVVAVLAYTAGGSIPDLSFVVSPRTVLCLTGLKSFTHCLISLRSFLVDDLLGSGLIWGMSLKEWECSGKG